MSPLNSTQCDILYLLTMTYAAHTATTLPDMTFHQNTFQECNNRLKPQCICTNGLLNNLRLATHTAYKLLPYEGFSASNHHFWHIFHEVFERTGGGIEAHLPNHLVLSTSSTFSAWRNLHLWHPDDFQALNRPNSGKLIKGLKTRGMKRSKNSWRISRRRRRRTISLK